MAAAARRHNLLLIICVCLLLLHSVCAAALVSRKAIVTTTPSGNVTVVDSASRQAIQQGAATDGAGDGYSLPAIVWIGFGFALGVPMSFAGIRGWRLTTGVGVAVSMGVLSWAAIISSVDNVGLSDIILTAIVFGLMLSGFCLGVFEFARVAATLLIVLNGGLAFGVRVVLIKEGLLFANSFGANWAIVAIFGILPGLVMFRIHRAVLVFGCASIGTFLMFLAIDLVLNKQEGLSRGLRFLFDRNDSHLAACSISILDIISHGYHPPFTTRINVYVSLASTPILAFAQHKIFKQSFNRRPPPESDSELNINYPTEMIQRGSFSQYFSNKDRNTNYGGNKLRNASRFSL
ncbi:hypothetical protein BDZ89DRAFT_939550 [Hymenopellis radicata]|nr:hypothetical protein BDZ89DRAFT_939550 [Hymenopellis radicata]